MNSLVPLSPPFYPALTISATRPRCPTPRVSTLAKKPRKSLSIFAITSLAPSSRGVPSVRRAISRRMRSLFRIFFSTVHRSPPRIRFSPSLSLHLALSLSPTIGSHGTPTRDVYYREMKSRGMFASRHPGYRLRRKIIYFERARIFPSIFTFYARRIEFIPPSPPTLPKSNIGSWIECIGLYATRYYIQGRYITVNAVQVDPRMLYVTRPPPTIGTIIFSFCPRVSANSSSRYRSRGQARHDGSIGSVRLWSKIFPASPSDLPATIKIAGRQARKVTRLIGERCKAIKIPLLSLLNDSSSLFFSFFIFYNSSHSRTRPFNCSILESPFDSR